MDLVKGFNDAAQVVRDKVAGGKPSRHPRILGAVSTVVPIAVSAAIPEILRRVFSDGEVTDEERAELQQTLNLLDKKVRTLQATIHVLEKDKADLKTLALGQQNAISALKSCVEGGRTDMHILRAAELQSLLYECLPKNFLQIMKKHGLIRKKS